MSTQQSNRPTTQQQHIWQQQQLHGTIFSACCQVTIEGLLRPSVLLNALRRAASKHEIFRTYFRNSDEGLIVCMSEECPGIDSWQQEWTGLAAPEQQAKIQAAWAEEVTAITKLDHGPLLRVGLVRLDDLHHELLLTAPSLCADAESLMSLAAQATEYYANPNFQESPETPQYSHYAEWQHQLVTGIAAKRGIEYWRRVQRRCDAGNRSAWEINERGSGRLCSVSIEINQVIMSHLQALAASHGSRLEMVLLACWQVLLWRLNDQNPVSLCTWHSGRDSADLQCIQGNLGKYLPVTSELHGRTEFKAFVEQLGQSHRANAALREYWPAGSCAGAIQFIYRDLRPMCTGGMTKFHLHKADMQSEFGEMALKCVVAAEDGRLRLETELQYDPERCNAEFLQSLPSRWRRLLLSVIEGWSAPIECLQMVDEAEHRKLLHDFNPARHAGTRPICLQTMFEEQVEDTPQAQALVREGQHISYEQLNRKANKLARYLRRKGIAPEVVVAIALESSLEMVQAVLAVLKAGGAYLPLDPTYPIERLRYMLEDSRATVIVGQTELLTTLAEFAGTVQWICPEAESHLIDEESDENLLISVDLANLAYMIYTSGSTGRPKATMIPHSGVVNYLGWALEYYGSGTGSLLHSPLAFDLTVTSLFLPLLCGRCVELVKMAEGAEIRALADALSQVSGPLLLKITPAHANLLGQTTRPEKIASRVDVMVVGGEALHPSDIAWCRQYWPQVRIINEYGPTETVVGCCIYEIQRQEHLMNTVPIGHPIANTRMYVLDQHLQLTPIGTQGEIYISGEGVGRGYFARPELTAERFLPDPWAELAGQRMYRTGDLGRWRDSGVLECLGRNDHQVKLAGYRIELGEIEAVLRELNVRDAAVVKHQGMSNECLVAYVALREKQSLDKRAVQLYLAGKLPHYMVPELIVFLPQLPYTANGKLNRKALPDPFQMLSGTPFVAPRTEVERLLAGIWAEVLERPQIGVEDGFFDLGGHSMSAVRIAARIHSALGIELTAQHLFDAETVARLASIVEEELRKGSGIPASLPQPIPRNIPLPLSYAQSRLWFFDQLSPGNTNFNLVQALRIAGVLQLDILERCCNEVLRRHEILRTTFPTVRGEAHQAIAPHSNFNLTVVDLSCRSNPRAEAEQLILREEHTPFNLGKGPLIRISVYRLATEEHIVVFAVHHIIFDGWSTGVFMREFGALYAAFCTGLPSSLPELQIQYADFAYWERATIQGERLQKHLHFWRRELYGPLPILDLPLDHSRPAMQTFRGGKHDFAVSQQLTEALHQLAHRNGATLFMTLVGAFNCLLYSYTAQTDMIVGTDVANRNSAAAEALIGFFINQVPLRISLRGNPEFVELLARVREKTLSTYTHQELPFDRLVDALRIERKVSSAPIFQVKLVLENIPEAKMELPGLNITPLEFTHIAAKLDLTLLLRETAEGITGWFEYNSDLFEPLTIATMAEAFQSLLNVVVEDPSIRLDDLARRLGSRKGDVEPRKKVAAAHA